MQCRSSKNGGSKLHLLLLRLLCLYKRQAAVQPTYRHAEYVVTDITCCMGFSCNSAFFLTSNATNILQWLCVLWHLIGPSSPTQYVSENFRSNFVTPVWTKAGMERNWTEQSKSRYRIIVWAQISFQFYPAWHYLISTLRLSCKNI